MGIMDVLDLHYLDNSGGVWFNEVGCLALASSANCMNLLRRENILRLHNNN